MEQYKVQQKKPQNSMETESTIFFFIKTGHIYSACAISFTVFCGT